jgi:hypothetical protein
MVIAILGVPVTTTASLMLAVKLICPAGIYVAFAGAVMELTDGAVRSIVTVLVDGEFEAGPVCPVDEPKMEFANNCGVNVPSLHELTVNV